MQLRKDLCLFAIGGGCYIGIELAYRGFSHCTMFLLGGICFWLIGSLGRLRPRPGLPLQILLGAVICTAGELIFGLLFNRDYTIWDYRQQPWNIAGQICPVFTLLWIPLSFLAAVVFDWCDALLSRPSPKAAPKERLL